jgi:hypothetical protein
MSHTTDVEKEFSISKLTRRIELQSQGIVGGVARGSDYRPPPASAVRDLFYHVAASGLY